MESEGTPERPGPIGALRAEYLGCKRDRSLSQPTRPLKRTRASDLTILDTNTSLTVQMSDDSSRASFIISVAGSKTNTTTPTKAGGA